MMGQSSNPRWLVLALLVTAAVTIPRSLLIVRAHSETWDEQYHLSRGLAQLTRVDFKEYYNDPPLGEVLLALPLWITGCTVDAPARADPTAWRAADKYAVLYGQPISPEMIRCLIAIWKCVLFLPFAAVVFMWCRGLFGVASAWIALGAILVDPTIAAHLPLAALDVLSLESIVIACYCIWRYAPSPTKGRFVTMCFAVAAAMLIKHIGMITPAVAIMAVYLYRAGAPTRAILNRIAAGALLTIAFLWALTLFDFSPPKQHCDTFSGTYSSRWGFVSDVVNPNLARCWPGGIYIASLVQGVINHTARHANYLWGSRSETGWWYYHVVLATYKIPIGLWILLLTGAASVCWKRVTRDEVFLLVATGAWSVLLAISPINTGFRHALVPHVLLLIFATRIRLLAWLLIAVAAIHVALWHPDYLSYINFPRRDVARQISDSNIDWGQSLKQIRAWLDANPHPEVALAYFGDPSRATVVHHLGSRVTSFTNDDPIPTHGILIISEVLLWNDARDVDRFAFLRTRKPIARIGPSIGVYDLDSADKMKPE